MRGCRKCQIYERPDRREYKCVICDGDMKELIGDLECNGGCNKVRPVYKWMAAAFDRPYPYCERCFPRNWYGNYLIDFRSESQGYYKSINNGHDKVWQWYDEE